MSYYIRFIVTDSEPVTLHSLETALRETDVNYSIDRDNESDVEGSITFCDELYGQIEINRPDDGLFDEEIGELKDFVSEAEGERKPDVERALNEAKAIIAVQVLFQDRESESTLEKLDPLWNWLLENRQGLMQAGGEGYYDNSGLILEVT